MELYKKHISDLGRIVTGKTPRTSISENYGGHIPFLTPSDDLSGKYAYKTSKTLSELGLKEVKNCLLPPNSICVSCIGSDLGKVIITNKPTVTNQQFNSIIPNEENNADFVYYLMSVVGKHLNFLSKTSTAVPIINKSSFSDFEIEIPSLDDQIRIATVLSSLDDKIECNRQINDNFTLSFLLLAYFVLWLLKLRNDNLEQQAQALFKSWLSHCSKIVTIGDLSLNITDYTKCEREEVVLINSSDVTEGHFEHHILSENKNLKGHFKKRFQKGDILYSQVRPRNRHWAFCTFDSNNYLASTQLMVIRNRPNVIPSILLYQYIIDDNVWLEFTLKTETRSGTFPQGNYEDLSSVRVPFGADTKSISASLERIYNLIYCNEDESRRLAQLRDTLLPRLMSGELKVEAGF